MVPLQSGAIVNMIDGIIIQLTISRKQKQESYAEKRMINIGREFHIFIHLKYHR